MDTGARLQQNAVVAIAGVQKEVHFDWQKAA